MRDLKMAGAMMDSLFQRSLDDLVKGLRLQMIGEARYLAKSLEEIRKEIKSTDAQTKVVALQKLTYLHMLQGSDMAWASFHVVEVMTMSKFAYKKIGYLAASQSFHEGTDVLLLITNLLRKDMGSKNEYEAGVAIECLSRIANPDIASALTPEVFTMMTSGRVYVRKKATLVLLRVFSKYPDAIRVAFKRLVEKLDDSDSQVVCAAVSVLCELALKDPRSYLPLAPEFYRLLESSTNNWLSIKLVKIFGALAPVEPRLGRKIAGPLCEHMRKTHAKSLLFECIHTVTVGLADHAGAVKLVVEKLRELMIQGDPNLKYLGLRALAALMPVHPWAVADNKEVIVKCLSDGDPSIQRGALCLIMGMVSESNVAETVQVLLQYSHSTDPSFCNELVSCILTTCGRAQYELISDFPWYISVLAEIAQIPNCEHGEEVGRQLMDIALRVKSVRSDIVKATRDLLVDPALLDRAALQGVLCAAAWLVGEYVELAPFGAYELLEALLQPRTQLLPSAVRAVYLQAVFKVFVFFASACYQKSSTDNRNVESQTIHSGMAHEQEDLGLQVGRDSEGHGIPALGVSYNVAVELVKDNVGPLVNSVEVEVQERACNLLGLLQVLDDGKAGDQHRQKTIQALEALQAVFGIELGPVSVHAQGRVAVPEGLVLVENLDALGPIRDSGEVSIETGKERPSGTFCEWEDGFSFSQRSKENPSVVDESVSLLAEHRHRHESYYLPTDAVSHDYPPPHIASTNTAAVSTVRAAATSTNSSMLTENSSLWTKPRQAKARRPVVVKLDDEDNLPRSSVPLTKKGLKDEFVSSAIRDVLASDGLMHRVGVDVSETGRLASSSSRRHRHSQRQTKRLGNGMRQEENSIIQAVDVGVSEGQSTQEGHLDEINRQVSEVSHKAQSRSLSKHRASKHEILVLERGQSSISEEEGEGTFELKAQVRPSGKQKQRHSQRHHRHHARSPASNPAIATPIPDFLL